MEWCFSRLVALSSPPCHTPVHLNVARLCLWYIHSHCLVWRWKTGISWPHHSPWFLVHEALCITEPQHDGCVYASLNWVALDVGTQHCALGAFSIPVTSLSCALVDCVILCRTSQWTCRWSCVWAHCHIPSL